MKDGVAVLSQRAKGEWDWSVAQLDIAGLTHDSVGIGTWNGEVGQAAMVLFEAFGAFGVQLARHLSTEVSELFAELGDLAFRLEVLEGAADGCIGQADGDGMEGVGVKIGTRLEDVDR